jgi:hypothetical protein
MALLQDAATTGNGTVLDLAGQGECHAFYVQWASGVTAGELILETARTSTYTGTWESIETFVFGDNVVQSTVVWGPLKCVRARITTTVSGGSAPSVTVEHVRGII